MGKSIQTEPATSPLTVLALDLGTKTGWALHGQDHSITSGTVLFKNDRWQGGGMRFLRFNQWLTEIKQVAGSIDAIFFEEVRRHMGVDVAHAYGLFQQGGAVAGWPLAKFKHDNGAIIGEQRQVAQQAFNGLKVHCFSLQLKEMIPQAFGIFTVSNT